MKALILAAGQGTRLKRLTQTRPKPMLPIGGKPLLQHTIEWLKAHRVVDIAINVHHHPQTITEYFGDGSTFGVSIVYSHEETLLGTAGAAKRLAAFLDENFVVIYGDVFTTLDLTHFIQFHNCESTQTNRATVMTLALYHVSNPTQCGIVGLDSEGHVTRFVEKPLPDQVFSELAFSGVMICQPEILDYIPVGSVFDFGHDLIPTLLTHNLPMRAEAIAINESVIDIGTLPGYLNALRYFYRSVRIPPKHATASG